MFPVANIKLSTLPRLHERIFISSCNQTSLLVFGKIAFRVQNNWLPSCAQHIKGLRNFLQINSKVTLVMELLNRIKLHMTEFEEAFSLVLLRVTSPQATL